MSKKREQKEKEPEDFGQILACDEQEAVNTEGEVAALCGLDVESLEEQVSRLKAYATRFMSTPHAFKPGDIIRWKRGMKNKCFPANDTPIIVIEVLTTPIYDREGDAGSPYFKEPLTLVAGCLKDDGQFTVFHYDSRRFEPCTL